MRTTAVLACLALAASARATTTEPGRAIARASGPIQVDGRLDEPAWGQALRLDTWYETSPGDNTPPPVKNVGWLTFSARNNSPAAMTPRVWSTEMSRSEWFKYETIMN